MLEYVYKFDFHKEVVGLPTEMKDSAGYPASRYMAHAPYYVNKMFREYSNGVVYFEMDTTRNDDGAMQIIIVHLEKTDSINHRPSYNIRYRVSTSRTGDLTFSIKVCAKFTEQFGTHGETYIKQFFMKKLIESVNR